MARFSDEANVQLKIMVDATGAVAMLQHMSDQLALMQRQLEASIEVFKAISEEN